jgi:phosphocarrier protein FPr
LADGVCALAGQISAQSDLRIAAAGGLVGGGLGTSFEKIQQAVDAVYSDDGVLILMDLGSAVMTAQMVLEVLPPERRSHIRLSNAPLVEGAIAAAVSVSLGDDLDRVQRAAETALAMPKISPEEAPLAPPAETPAAPVGPSRSVMLVISNPIGLHARPAALFVQTASQFTAQITVQNVTQNRQPVNAKSMMQVASQASARQGERIHIVAQGEDADKAIAALTALVEAGFGEMEEGQETAVSPQPPAPQSAPAPVVSQVALPPYLQGIGASEGYAIAPAFVYRQPDLHVARRVVEDPQSEVSRFRQALDVARRQLDQVQQHVSATADEQTGRIFEFHRMILEDAELHHAVEDGIIAGRCNAEAAVNDVISQWVGRFESLNDELMRERATDVRDVGERVLRVLLGIAEDERSLSGLAEPVIVAARDLTPSDTARLDREKVRGLCTAMGGATSHVAILARMWNLPAVVGLGDSLLQVADGTILALDGESGQVEIGPPPEVVQVYQEREARRVSLQAEALRQIGEPAITQDGRQVEVVANVGDVASAREALEQGAEGIGLLRTEFLYLERATLPDEEEQVRVYRAIAEVMGQRPVIIRTLDVGGDKPLPSIHRPEEANPALGVRAIRLSRLYPDLLRVQLRAILRAGVAHNLKVMFPLVATLDEVRWVKSLLRQAQAELAAEGVEHVREIEAGIMIETPAAALMADALAAEVDFFSIGSNDLTQYTLACDRGNENLGDLYSPLNPAVLRLIRGVIEAAHAAGIWVGLCGELAGQRKAIPVLLGLGLDEFSMTPSAIPSARQTIRALSADEAEQLASHVLSLTTLSEVEALLHRQREFAWSS